jgi:hypothetical protein
MSVIGFVKWTICGNSVMVGSWFPVHLSGAIVIGMQQILHLSICISLGFVWMMNSFAMRNFRLSGEVSFVLCVWNLKLSQWWVSRPLCSGVRQHDVSYMCDSEGVGSRCFHFTDACLHQTTWCHIPEHRDISSLCLILKTVIVCACNVVINLTIEDTRNKYRIFKLRTQETHTEFGWRKITCWMAVVSVQVSLLPEDVHVWACEGTQLCSHLGICAVLTGYPNCHWGPHIRWGSLQYLLFSCRIWLSERFSQRVGGGCHTTSLWGRQTELHWLLCSMQW